MDIKIKNQCILEWANQYNGPAFHALICDPPYELGFMGKKWDSSGIAFQSDTWASIARHLLPGAFGMAFASTRGYHRMAVAIEDAGLIIHPVIMAWGFGSGFPKATRIDTAIDKKMGTESTVVATQRRYNEPSGIVAAGRNERKLVDRKILTASTKEGQVWAGYRYGLQALKPALEPIAIFQKPYDGKPVDSISGTGAGALNIDASRVPSEKATGWSGAGGAIWGGGQAGEPRPVNGRWPANLVLSYPEERKDEVVGVFPVGVRGAVPGSQRVQGSGGGSGGMTYSNGNFGYQKISGMKEEIGSAARFFFNAVHEQIDEADPLFYCAKASGKEREAGLNDGPKQKAGISAKGRGWSESNPWKEIRRANHHPTVKPVNLIKYLSTLLLPPIEYAPRRIMVPFAGSGSEMIGAMLAGWEEVLGVEREGEYADIAQRRVEFWGQKRSTLF
jgi:hypothetical protein